MDQYDYLSNQRDVIDGIYIDHYGNKYHYKNGFFHNEDGPAVIYVSGYKEYHLNGKYIPISTDKEFAQYKKLIAFQ
jgi:hypothetical protein